MCREHGMGVHLTTAQDWMDGFDIEFILTPADEEKWIKLHEKCAGMAVVRPTMHMQWFGPDVKKFWKKLGCVDSALQLAGFQLFRVDGKDAMLLDSIGSNDCEFPTFNDFGEYVV
ncbi:Hypothetical predicted protein [Scomber scombrus]|uniref:Uncharacterized protein n=1 Tax=Scomber scombrus TaxID=13677 RepID=A0AAV1PFC1_SCOSC